MVTLNMMLKTPYYINNNLIFGVKKSLLALAELGLIRIVEMVAAEALEATRIALIAGSDSVDIVAVVEFVGKGSAFEGVHNGLVPFLCCNGR